MSVNGKIGRTAKGRFDYGNAFKVKLPYEYKLIRDSIKSAIYATASGLAMPTSDALEYYRRPEATLLDTIFADAISKKQYDIIEKFFDRIMGKPQMQISMTDAKTMLDEITEDQKRNAIEAASRTIESKK